MRITGKHKVRKAISALPVYYSNKSEIIKAVETVLRNHGIETFIPGMPDDSGSVICPLFAADNAGIICDCCRNCSRDEFGNGLFLSWYRMPSGKIELTCYIS